MLKRWGSVSRCTKADGILSIILVCDWIGPYEDWVSDFSFGGRNPGKQENREGHEWDMDSLFFLGLEGGSG